MTTESPAGPGGDLLVVDDTAASLKMLAGMLKAAGHRVRPAISGKLALEAARAQTPDLVLLDITMPEMDGYEVCAELKRSEQLRDVPVIFLSALGDPADKVKAFGVGGADYVTKPFRSEEVLARVGVHLALRQARVELQRNYERLRGLERLRDDLVTMVVHDMRSPLTVLMANLEFLREAIASDQASEDLRGAIQASAIVNRMANDLLDVSRMEEGKMPLVLAATDMRRLAEDVARDLRAWTRTRTIDVMAGEAVEVSCDAALMRRVIENIVNNALKHTPSSGAIRVVVRASAGGARLEVHDQGPGVPADARARIFEKFGTVEARRDRSYHSAGLGLAFCKLAVEAHGGSIGVDVGEETGSIFWFELPAAGIRTPD
jgi:signal transduction histidine kinase